MKKYFFIVFSLFIFSYPALSNIHYKTVSQNEFAQTLFDDGMLNYYGYLYVQAEYNFRKALIHDAECGMCYWGLALAKKQQAMELGLPFAKVGLDEINKAKKYISPKDGFKYDVIQTANQTFSLEKNISSKQLQIQYINALRQLNQKYKDNKEWREESLALLVDAIAYYANVDDSTNASNNHCSRPLNDTYRHEALNLLVPVLNDTSYADHPGLLHTYIHLAERNSDDDLLLSVAKKLPAFSYNKIAHYTHMPNHVYWRRGMFDKAIKANLNTINIDNHYFQQGGVGLNSYYYEYHYLHSHHFLAVLGVLTNDFDLSIKYAKAVKQLMDVNRVADLKDYRDIFFSLEHLVLARFEKWQEVLKLDTPQLTDDLGFLFINFAKALAYLNLKREADFNKLYEKISHERYSRKEMIDYQTLVITYLNITKMRLNNASPNEIEGLILKNGVDKIENKLANMNPPIWFFPLL